MAVLVQKNFEQQAEASILLPQSVRPLRSWWNVFREESRSDVGILLSAAAKAKELGDSFLASDILRKAHADHPENVETALSYALALADCGAVETSLLLCQGIPDDVEVVFRKCALLGRIHKDLYSLDESSAAGAEHMRKSTEAYRKCCEIASATESVAQLIYATINVATMSLFAGNEALSASLAQRVKSLASTAVAATSLRSSGDRFWVLASVIEADVLMQSYSASEASLSELTSSKEATRENLGRLRRQLRRIMHRHGREMGQWDIALQRPTLYLFTGHMITGERALDADTIEALEQLSSTIRGKLQSVVHGVTYSSAALGADIVFLEVAQELGFETNIIIPGSLRNFRSHSLSFGGSNEWRSRYQRVIRRASGVHFVEPATASPTDHHYHNTNLLMDGLVELRARSIDGTVVRLAATRGDAESQSPGGAIAFSRYWRSRGKKVTELSFNPTRETGQNRQGADVTPGGGEGIEVATMLFLDTVGFTSITDDHVGTFLDVFNRSIADIVFRGKWLPNFVNSWGDAVFAVFRSPIDAGLCALEIRDRIRSTHWADKGLPAKLGVRIGLHTGPVIKRYDPIARKITYFGANVNIAARIEPIAPPNEVFASEAFAAHAASLGSSGFGIEYAGKRVLSKNHSLAALYILKRVEAVP